MLLLLVEGSHARPTPPLPRPLPPAAFPPPPVGDQPGTSLSKWTVVLGRERPKETEGFDPGKSSEGREDEVMSPTVLPWERTWSSGRPPAGDETETDVSRDYESLRPQSRGELLRNGERGASETSSSSRSVINGGNGTLPIPLYGIMTDEVSSDVDLMLGGEGRFRGGRVPSDDWEEELVMWRLTNHDRRKGQLDTEEELISRKRRTPLERKERKKEGNKKKKKKEEERERKEKDGEGRQGRRKGKKRPRWRERRRQEVTNRRKVKEGRVSRERGEKGEEEGGTAPRGARKRRKDSMESNTRPQHKRHKGHQLDRSRQIAGLVPHQRSRPKGPRGDAIPKKPPGSSATGKSSRLEGLGSAPREGGSSGEGGGVSSGSGNLEDGAARSERSANLSHITGTARKIQMYVKNRYLQIDPWGRVSGAEDEDSDYTILQRTSVSTGRLKIQGVATCLFLCMDRCGLLYGSKNFTEECVWKETIEQHHYNTYSSVAYSNQDRALYLALNGAGKPRRVQVQRKEGRGLVLGKLSTYVRVLTRTVTQPRIQRLSLKLLQDKQRDAIMTAVIAAGGSIPVVANVSSQSGTPPTHQPSPTSLANPSLEPNTNPGTSLSSILSFLGLDPSIVPPDFNLDSITFADHPLRHHGYHQLCPMPPPNMVTSGSELVGKNGKVLCKKKENVGGNDKGGGKGGSGGGSGDGKKKIKKNNDRDGQKRRKRKGQSKDVGEVEEKRKKGGRQSGKRGGGGGGGGGGSGGGGGARGNGGGRVRKAGGEKGKMTKGKGGKERKGEINMERNGDKKGERKGERNGKRNGERNGDRNGDPNKKKKNNNNRGMKERERGRERDGKKDGRNRRIRKRPCGVGGRPRKDKECDKKRKRHRRGKDEVHHEQILHNNTLEEKTEMEEENEVEGSEEATEAPLEWEEDEGEVEGEEEENEGNSEEEEGGDEVEKLSEGSEKEGDEEEEDLGEEDLGEEDLDEEEEDEGIREEDEEDEGDGDDDDGEDDDDEDEGDEEYDDEDDDGGENDGRGINIRRKRKKDGERRRGKRGVESDEESENS